jgi:pre-mRNA-splicing factor 38A
VKLKYIGGTYSNSRPTKFICLAFKLLQIQWDREFIMTYLRAEEFKYLQVLAVFYIRLMFLGFKCYQILEPFLNDYRKLRERLDLVGRISMSMWFVRPRCLGFRRGLRGD